MIFLSYGWYEKKIIIESFKDYSKCHLFSHYNIPPQTLN